MRERQEPPSKAALQGAKEFTHSPENFEPILFFLSAFHSWAHDEYADSAPTYAPGAYDADL